MKRLFSSLGSCIIIFSLHCCGSSSTPDSTPQKMIEAPKPQWLVDYPVIPNYYTGIGSALKNQFGAEAQKSAQDLALADMASQITVTVTSDILTTLIEKGAITEEEYIATTRSQAVADLEGHELVDTFQDQNYFYAYYRLSKARYAAVQARKRQAALNLSTDFILKARDAHDQNNFSESFSSAVQAFIPLIPYLNEALAANIDGESVILSNDLNELFHVLLTDITLTPNRPRVPAKLGKPVSENLIIHAQNANGKAIRNLPLKVHFVKGDGELPESINTGGRGFAQIQITSITSGEKLQIVETLVDLSGLINDSYDPVLRGVIQTIPLPSVRIILDVINPTIYLVSSEMFDGKTLTQLQVEPRLKNLLIENGFHFVDIPDQADWEMTLRASANKGTEFSGMFTAFADVSLSLVDRTNGDEIYKNAISREKGIDLSYPNAANKALNNAIEKLNASVLPEIMKSLK
ncbi:MAG: LPP20 family lipoprotein [FCB group bacterium]|nr:LPP20 family lipoprotein [FCB group bacterium]